MTQRPIAYETRAGDVYHPMCWQQYARLYQSEIGERPALPERLHVRRPLRHRDGGCIVAPCAGCGQPL